MEMIGFEAHDHAACRSGGLAAAERYCEANGLRLTPIRRRVLELLLESHKALGAYDLLDRIRDERLGSQPPVIYRALDFLTQHGFAHRLERLNAFIGCAHPDGDAHRPAFLICRDCKLVAEAAAPRHADLTALADETGFAIERVVLEAEGLCPACQVAA
jgi:Fur family zinc uptake transcriptional regulator